jgi:lysozyme
MKIGSRGLALIKQFEGLRLEAYQDSAGVWTIGYGHTAVAGPPAPASGLCMTRAEAEALLARDLGAYEAAVASALKRPPGQHQFDAMVSLCFNIGARNFARSRLVRAFNEGDHARAAELFLPWNRAGGSALAGLTRRRLAEKRLFLSRGTSSAKWAIAGAGGTVGGTLAAGVAESIAFGAGQSLSSTLDWRGFLVIGGLIGLAAMAALWAMGEDRRERLWDRIVGL